MSLVEILKSLFGGSVPAAPGAVGGGVSFPITTTFSAAVPQAPVGIRESRDLVAHGHPELVRRFGGFKTEFEQTTGRQLFITCVWRSPECQFEYFQVGRQFQPASGSAPQFPGALPMDKDANGIWVVVNKAIIKTNIDGYKKKGRHNVFPSQAVDVAIDFDPGPGKHLSWDAAAYAPFAQLAPKHGLVWGGDWNGNGRSDDERFVDRPHLELPAGIV